MAVISTYPNEEQITPDNRFLKYDDGSGTTKLVPANLFKHFIGDGWIPANESWSFSAWNGTTKVGTINVGSGAPNKYTEGMRIRFEQPTLGVKYGIVADVDTSAIDVWFHSGDELDNEAVEAPHYSTAWNPQGFSTDASVTLGKTDFGVVNDTVTSLHSTTSSSYTNLTSNGPVQTVDVPPSGKVKVTITVEISNDTLGASSFAGVEVTGANSISPSDARSIRLRQFVAGYKVRYSLSSLYTGLTPGETTFRMQYRVTGGTGEFSNREIIVEPTS